MTILAARRRLVVSTKIDRDHPHSVTDTQDRDVYLFIKPALDPRGILVRHARRSAGQDHAFRPFRGDRLSRKMKRVYLAINTLLPNPPGDQLSILRAKIQN